MANRKQTGLAAGDLRHRVTLERPAEPGDQDTFGEPDDLWSVEAADLYGLVEDLSGNRLTQAQALAAEATTQVTIRWRPGSGWARKRFRFKGRELNILHVANPDMIEVALVALCDEEVR